MRTGILAQCGDATRIEVVDTFCTGTKYIFGDTLITSAGIYERLFRDQDNCDSIVSLNLHETPNVNFVIDIDTIAPHCIGDSLGGFIINVNGAVDPVSYVLYEGLISFNQIRFPLENASRSNVFDNLRFGVYTVVMVDRYGCAGLKNINLALQPLQGPMFIDTLCMGGTYRLGEQRITEPGMYFDTLTGSLGCDSVVTIDLRLEDLGNEISPDIDIIPPGCSPGETGTIRVNETTGDAPPFQYFLDSIPFENEIDMLSNGSYKLIIQDRHFCSTEIDIVLNPASDFFELHLQDVESVELGRSIEVQIESNFEISELLWSPTPPNACDQCLEFQFSPIRSQEYILTAKNIEGCFIQDTLSVVVVEGRPYFAPDAIRPNSVVLANQRFTILANNAIVTSVTDFFIFDKYGNLMHRQDLVALNDLSQAWDARLHGNLVESGVYSYRATIQLINDNLETIGGTFLVLY